MLAESWPRLQDARGPDFRLLFSLDLRAIDVVT